MADDELLLPDDIIINILCRLPVKILIQCRCVCKHWKNLFKTQHFITYFLSQNQEFHRLGYTMNLTFSSLSSDFGRHSINSLSPVNVFYSRKDLFCLEFADCDMISPNNPLLLWNRRIRKVQKVPQTSATNFKGRHSCVGFGFSSKINDYKIVRIYVPENDRVEVYSLSTDSWKEIKPGNVLEGLRISLRTVTMHNGLMYWFAWKQEREDRNEINYDMLVSFDIVKEIFSLLPIPAFEVAGPRSHLIGSYHLSSYDRLALRSPLRPHDYRVLFYRCLRWKKLRRLFYWYNTRPGF
ncbi:probable F-box protein At5g47300 [Prosopis cineraria]|uniref:probable F-box protein At5g47300 n=1 Tax=Prosopis cineraria TaxID=364024 RepID=UPI002410924B|nr:probable F-box protein At5g47300 [Prosopis cineraria]